MRTIFVACILAAALASSAQQGTMNKAEKMTDAEKKQRDEAIAKVRQAQTDLKRVEAAIAGAHGFGEEHWMEWSRWYEFDGDFIVERRSNYMALQQELISK